MSGPTRGSLALTRLGAIVVGLEGERVTGFFAPGERTADCDLAAVLTVPVPAGSAVRLVEVAHAGGSFVMAVHGRVRITAEAERPPERPPLVEGIFRRACLRGVVRHESELVYLLDVEEIASRIRREEGAP
jgi:chemotaxis signal transduction protein